MTHSTLLPKGPQTVCNSAMPCSKEEIAATQADTSRANPKFG